MHDRVQWKTQRPRHQSTKWLKAPVKWSASYRCVIHKSTTTTHQMKQKTTRVYQPSTPCIQCTAETTKYQNVVWSINDVDMLYLSSWIVRWFHVTSGELNLDSQSKKTIHQWSRTGEGRFKNQRNNHQVRSRSKDKKYALSLRKIVMSEFGFAAVESFDEFIQKTFTWIRIRDPENRKLNNPPRK